MVRWYGLFNLKPYARPYNTTARLRVGRTTRNRRKRKSRFPLVAVLVLIAGAFAYGGAVLWGGPPTDAASTVTSSAKIATPSAIAPNQANKRVETTSTRVGSPVLRGAPTMATPSVVSSRPDASPRGAASGIRRGEILPGERLEAALRRMGISQNEIRGLVRSLVTVFDAADSHAGDTFIAQTDSSGAVLWFELRTLRGVSVGARRRDAALVAYRKDAAPAHRPGATGNSAHAAARNG
ncbi:MAG: hypothetical protein HYY84_01195 [Deltaproteobacteria bacterium]|nr:hypothetical protein [Deltaproteobacteria bacterium]